VMYKLLPPAIETVTTAAAVPAGQPQPA
jgi:hypothetical protein